MSSMNTVSEALDRMFERPEGLYGALDQTPVIRQEGHYRRIELLQSLEVGDVSTKVCADFGMGSWGFASVYPRLHDCKKAIGFDISNAAIKATQQLIADTQPKYGRVFEAYQSDGMAIPLPNESVDLFFSGESIEHVRFVPKYLNEIYRILKHGGQLVVTTPNRNAIKYKKIDEEYCTSPEHFSLMDYRELIDVISIFFVVKEAYGFNGSYGSHEEDRTQTHLETAKRWSREFKDRPDLATGIILRLEKKTGISGHYEITDIPHDQAVVTKANINLSLEFGLTGLLLEDESQNIVINRPASDGIVCRFWCHRWSGIAAVEHSGKSDELDLYAFVPGWRQWIAAQPTSTTSVVKITPTMSKNPLADAAQVIFFEAFTWRYVDGPAPAWEAPRPLVYVPTSTTHGLGVRVPFNGAPILGYGFTRFAPFVGTTLFLWFSQTEGNQNGPWPPIGGRSTWKGDKEFWKTQIREVMLANIDALYVHCIDGFHAQRHEFFAAYSELRAEGWDVPKIAPFLDPFGLFRAQPIDAATTAGKEAFAAPYVRFFLDYFLHNSDMQAATYLLSIDDRVVLTTWWVYSLVQNLNQFSREDLQSILIRDVGRQKIPLLSNPLYMMTTALVDPDLQFSDERMIMFSGYCYALQSIHQGVQVWHVQAGYWDQNIRTPGYFLPRDGGQNYKRAWEATVAAMPHVHRVYIESWNEYDEGSGIYAADPHGMVVNEAMHKNADRFSSTNDPYEYIVTTAAGAARINGRPALRARVLGHDVPDVIGANQTLQGTVWYRNEGNVCWPRYEGVKLTVSDRKRNAISAIPLQDALEGVGAIHDGEVFRGHPVAFSIKLISPETPGPWKLTLELSHAGAVVDGSEIQFDIRVGHQGKLG